MPAGPLPPFLFLCYAVMVGAAIHTNYAFVGSAFKAVVAESGRSEGAVRRRNGRLEGYW
jgi:hypothetical protein